MLVLTRIDPERAGFLAFVFFYTSLFFTLLGVFSLLEFFLRQRFAQQKLPAFLLVGPSLRHGALVALAMVGSLALQGAQLLTWWNIMFLLALVGTIEILALTKESQDASHAS